MISKKRKLRIAFFIPSKKEIGGGPKAEAKIASWLAERHHVGIFTQKYPRKELDFGKSKINLIKPSNTFLAPFAFLMKKVKGFDIILLGGYPSNFAAIRNSPSVIYCYSPTRAFYDLRKHNFKNSNLSGKIKLIIKNIFFKGLDYLSARRATEVLAISETVKERIKEYYHRNTDISYPGIDFHTFKKGEYGDYILSLSRLVSAKRVDMIIKSMDFVKDKKIKLIVAGDGDEKEKIIQLTKKNPNVEYKGFVDNKTAVKLYANALAVVYIPINEDEGYGPIEAGASAKATIGVNEGGLRETIINKKTGFLIDNVTAEKIAEKIDYLAKNRKIAKKMGKDAFEYTKKFDWENVLPSLEDTLYKVTEKKK